MTDMDVCSLEHGRDVVSRAAARVPFIAVQPPKKLCRFLMVSRKKKPNDTS